VHSTQHEPYLKAAGNDRLTPFYDLMARFGMRERAVKGRVIALARIGPGQRLLDVGCGTGTLALMAKEQHPDATIVGVDGDPTILRIARQKARRSASNVQFDEAMAYALPYPDGSFDAVVSTLTFHHLTPDQQVRALAEVRRVLRPGGRLALADLAAPHSHLMRLLLHLPLMHGRRAGRHPDGHAHMHAGPSPKTMAFLHELLSEAGWEDVESTERFISALGTIEVRAFTPPHESGQAKTGTA
jgi:ubiquinone/menaquinone biosynthesis C-methylase UbiE